MRLQHVLAEIWWALYSGTTYAVRDGDTDDDTWDEADNTYSDGRRSWSKPGLSRGKTRTSVGNTTDSSAATEQSTNTHGDHLSHLTRQPKDEHGVADTSPKDPPSEFAQFLHLLPPATDWVERALAEAQRLEDDDDGTP